MRRSLVFLTLVLTGPALAAGPDLDPARPGVVPDAAMAPPKGAEAVTKPRAAKPKSRELDPPLRPSVPAPTRVGPRAPTPRSQSPLGEPQLGPAGARGLNRTLSQLLRVDGRTGRVDLREHRGALASVEWQLSASDTDKAIVFLRRDPGSHCPRAGAAIDNLSRDPKVIASFAGASPIGSRQMEFAGDDFIGLGSVYVQACGMKVGRASGAASNVVQVEIRPTYHTARLAPYRWTVEWSEREDTNAVCGFHAGAIPPVGTAVGYRSVVDRGDGPVPCVRTTTSEFQPTAGFELSPLPDGARVHRAVLRFTESETSIRPTASGRSCPAATRAVGLSPTPPASGPHKVEAISGTATDTRNPSAAGGGQRTVDVTDWVRNWHRGPDDAVTFLGLPARDPGAACIAQLTDVHIDVEYE